MHFRPIKDNDILTINELNRQQDFSVDLRHKVVDGVVENNKGNVIAYGIVKRQAEAIILVDKSKPLVSRAKALRELMKVAIFGARSEGCQQLYCFVQDDKLADLLKTKFGFVDSKDRILVRNL